MEITGTSKIMFVLADPVDHVRASAVLNAYFAEIGEDLATSPLAVRPRDLGTVVDAIRCMGNVVGFGVTIPHKVAIMPLLNEVTNRARMIGAVNFVRRSRDGWLVGDNLDAPGFLAGLDAHGCSVEGKRFCNSARAVPAAPRQWQLQKPALRNCGSPIVTKRAATLSPTRYRPCSRQQGYRPDPLRRKTLI
jgi:hypothetical protein